MVERAQGTSQEAHEARPVYPNPSNPPTQRTLPDAATSAPASMRERYALSPMSEEEAREEEARRRELVTLGLEVALALLLTLAARIWDWVREERARARVNRELRRRLSAS